MLFFNRSFFFFGRLCCIGQRYFLFLNINNWRFQHWSWVDLSLLVNFILLIWILKIISASFSCLSLSSLSDYPYCYKTFFSLPCLVSLFGIDENAVTISCLTTCFAVCRQLKPWKFQGFQAREALSTQPQCGEVHIWTSDPDFNFGASNWTTHKLQVRLIVLAPYLFI